MKRCKDCITDGLTTNRKMATRSDGSLQPGPRCVTHHRAWKRRNRHLAHGRRLEVGYGITAEQYWQLYAAQNGRCWICRKATGRARRLAVDHDHVSGIVRGLLCSPCNVMIGRYGLDAFLRVLEYLHNPPAIGVIGRCIVPLTDA